MASWETSSNGLGWEKDCLLDYRKRISCIQYMTCNRICADCSAPNPQWASLLLDGGCVEGLGAVVCEECALHHHFGLGEERCFIKYFGHFHEWNHSELDVLEYCGNTLLNEVYEATLVPDSQDRSTSEQQAKFIKNKYKKCLYQDQEALEQALELVYKRTCQENENLPRRGSMDLAMSRRGSMETARSKSESMNTAASRRGSVEESIPVSRRSSVFSIGTLSLCSELDDSSRLSLCELVDNEEFYLDCAKKTATYSSERSTKSESNPKLEMGTPISAALSSGPARLAEAASPSLQNLRIPGRGRRPSNPILLRRLLTNPNQESPKEDIPLRRSSTVEPEAILMASEAASLDHCKVSSRVA